MFVPNRAEKIVSLKRSVRSIPVLPDHVKSFLSRNVPVSLVLEFGENPRFDQSSSRNHDSVNLQLRKMFWAENSSTVLTKLLKTFVLNRRTINVATFNLIWKTNLKFVTNSNWHSTFANLIDFRRNEKPQS